MSALPGAAAAIGSGFLASLGQALVSWWALLPLTVALLMLGASLYLRRRTRIGPFPKERRALSAAPPCPSCTGRPMESPDCTCPEPCGEAWCQAADPDDHEDTQPMDPGEVTDGAPRFFERLPVIDGDELAKLRRSRRYEDDTFISDGITRALRQILKEGDEGA